MRTTYAQVPPPEHSADRVFHTDNALIVLDGATPFVPLTVDAKTYADHLGRTLITFLEQDPDADLTEAVAAAIVTTANKLDLEPGRSPSSTITVLRESAAGLDLLTLGDNTIIIGTEPPTTILDDRLDQLHLPESERYRERLHNGAGYDDEHAAILRSLQQRQMEARNQAGGYWIAEANPDAARHAITQHYPAPGPSWALTMTDGAADHLGTQDALRLVHMPSVDLETLLTERQRWEQESDPTGRLMPRAKRSDDKTIAIAHRAA